MWIRSSQVADCVAGGDASGRFVGVVSNEGVVDLGVSGAWPRGATWSVWSEASILYPRIWTRTAPPLEKYVVAPSLGVLRGTGSMGFTTTEHPIQGMELVQPYWRVRLPWGWVGTPLAILPSIWIVGWWRRHRLRRAPGFRPLQAMESTGSRLTRLVILRRAAVRPTDDRERRTRGENLFHAQALPSATPNKGDVTPNKGDVNECHSFST